MLRIHNAYSIHLLLEYYVKPTAQACVYLYSPPLSLDPLF